ncbi:hypothetical protein [Geomonas ferrireducens]|uniref:hypothetical protein n=1 Tax=Geomonas ferrireducens TaxID=2570227 RepID=UPI0010A92B44|nr:hypothetical protein [Geomonas ferrireducens]
MNRGGWIPISKVLVKDLPRDRPFTRLEAIFSLTCDYDLENPVSVCGYSKLWRWSEGRVKRFIEEIGAHIEYPENTRKRQNQRGVIALVITEGSQRDSRGIRLIDSKRLPERPEGSRSDSRGKPKGSRTSTKEPNPDPNPEPLKKPLPKPKKQTFDSPLFAQFWEAYPKKGAKLAAQKTWLKINPDEHLLAGMLSALERQKRSAGWQKDRGQYIPLPEKWLNGHRWEDEEPAMESEQYDYADFFDLNRRIGTYQDKEGHNEG